MNPVLILLLVSPSDGRVLTAAEIEPAIIEVLGPVQVFTAEAPWTLSDREAAQRGRDLQATAIYRVRAVRSDPPEIELRIWMRGGDAPEGWKAGRLEFARNDSPREIARAVGYAAAAMLLPHVLEPSTTVTAAAPKTRPRWTTDAPVAATSIATPVATRPFLVDLAGVAAVTDNGGLAWGGALRGGWMATRWFRPTVAVAGGTETVDAAQSRASRLNLGFGAAFTFMTRARASLALRAEAEAIWQTATRFDQQVQQTARQSRWLPALSTALEGAVALSGATAVVLAAGYEFAAGATDLYVRGVKTAAIPSSRATAEIGVRVRF